MELDELKQAWDRVELRQDAIESLLRAEGRERRMHKARLRMRWNMAGHALELAAWIAFTVIVASFWVDHRHVLHWLVIGVLLHLYGIAGIWATATQWLLLTRVYLFDAPVLVLQRRLAQLRRFRVWCTLALGLPWWCLWLLVPLVGIQWLAGVDVYAAGNPAWIWGCMAVGVAGMVASVWLARRLAGRAFASAWLQRIVDDMGGCNLARAQRELQDLARFEGA